MRKGAYAGPVTLGKHDDTVKKAPSLRSCEIAGAVGGRSCALSSAALSVSGLTPSAIMMMTGTSIHTQESQIARRADEAALRKRRTDRALSARNLLANAPPSPIDLSGILYRMRGPWLRSPCHICF